MTEAPQPPGLDDSQPAFRKFATASREEMSRIVEALYHVHQLIAAITDLDTLLERITEESKKVAGAEASSLMLYDPGTNELRFHVALGESGDQETLKREIRLTPGQGIAGAAAQSRKSILVDDAQEDPRFFSGADAATQFRTRNLLAVPMLDHDNLIGVLEVVNKLDGGAFTKIDMRVLEMFSGLAASAIVNARLIEKQIHNVQLAAVGQAVTSLSHHTKNIVTGLQSSADLIEMGINTENVEVLRRCWPVFQRSTQRISNFVQDMLAFSKPRKPVREPVDVTALLNDACDTFSELFAQKQINAQMDIARFEHRLFVDYQGIYRMLLNLLINAAEVVPDTGGRIAISVLPAHHEGVEIWVTDNGPGISPEDIERVFDPFYSTKGSKGTGLGLAVSRKIVSEHQGTLQVDNMPEGGARFRIYLPNCQYPKEQTALQ